MPDPKSFIKAVQIFRIRIPHFSPLAAASRTIPEKRTHTKLSVSTRCTKCARRPVKTGRFSRVKKLPKKPGVRAPGFFNLRRREIQHASNDEVTTSKSQALAQTTPRALAQRPVCLLLRFAALHHLPRKSCA